jgi:murein DD-endopeptidase MepM/ murein hydrolase activator NlpD
VGERVASGAIIAAVGSSGLSSGPHLHYEVRVKGRRVDPQRYAF